MATRRGKGGGPRRGDDGFILLESMLSITLITVIMAALTSLFVTVIRVDSSQRARQVAVQVADSAASMVRSLPTSDLLTGRTQALVDAQWSSAPADVQPYLSAMEKALPAASGGTVVLPLALPPQVVHGISYVVNVYLGWCQSPAPDSPACVKPASSHDQLRAVFGVTWPDQQCPMAAGTPTCVYTSATLLSTAVDPVFALNQPAAAAPVVTLPSWTTYAVGDTVGLQLSASGVPQFTWAPVSGTWPGATLNTDGSVTGVLSTSGSTTLTVEVTDAFGRKAQGTFTWTVLPRLVATNPGAQSNALAVAITNLNLTATGGAGPAYTWSVDSTGPLPDGISLSSTGVVSGTPTRAPSTSYPKTYPVVLTVADSSGSRKATVRFDWRVVTTPSITTPAPGQVLLGAQVTLAVASTCPNTPCSYSALNLPPGLAIAAGTGSITGKPTAVGTFMGLAVTVTDSTNVSVTSGPFSWTVVGPTVQAPGNLSSQVGSPVKIPLVTTCPAGGCSYVVNAGPAGIAVDSAGLVTGTVGGSATSYPAVSVTVKDANGATVTSAPFSWTVAAAGGQVYATWPLVTTQGGTPDQPVVYSCTYSAGCVVSVTGQPSGIGLIRTPGDTATNHVTSMTVSQGTGTLYLSGTVSTTTALGTSTVKLTILRSNGTTVIDTDSGQWAVGAPPTVAAPANPSSRVGAPVEIRLAVTCQAVPCAYTLSGGPTGVTVDGTGLLTGTVGGSASTYSAVVVTARDANGTTATSPVFPWTVTATANISATWPVLTSPGAQAQQPLGISCPSGPCTVSVTGQPSGIGLILSPNDFATNHPVTYPQIAAGTRTGYLSGTVSPTAPKGTTTVTVTVTWPGGSATDSGTWTVR